MEGVLRISPSLRSAALKALVLLTLTIFHTGCGPEWKESAIFPSPDGKYVVVVTEELQGANDPEPWWQHISLYRAGEERKNRKGNLFVYSSKTSPQVLWKGPKDLQIQMDDISYSFLGPIDSPLSREVSITAVLKQPAGRRKG